MRIKPQTGLDGSRCHRTQDCARSHRTAREVTGLCVNSRKHRKWERGVGLGSCFKKKHRKITFAKDSTLRGALGQQGWYQIKVRSLD